MQDLQSFLEKYERLYPDEVWHVGETVDRDYVATACTLELERLGRAPVLVFEQVAGFDLPVVTNLFGSRTRIARMLGTSESDLTTHWERAMRRLNPPVLVDEGPAQQVVEQGSDVDLGRLPIVRHFRQDAGCYVTGGMVVANDPDSGVRNLAYARMQVKGPNRLGISLHSRGHLWDYQRQAERAGRNLPVAVVIGAHPAILVAASSRVAMDVDEYDIAGALLQEPVELTRARTVPVDVPTAAEIVLEGEILAGIREPEGPFGEYTGYATGRSTEHVLVVSAVTRRHRPVYLDVCPGFSNEHLFLGRVPKETAMLARLRDTLSFVRRVHYPKSGTHFHCYLAIEKTLEGQGRQAATLLFGLDPYVKLCVVVDSDVDVGNEEEVLWALATRFQADRDLFVIPDGLCNVLDPSSQGGVSAKLALDATRPLAWDVARCDVPPEAQARARELIARWQR